LFEANDDVHHLHLSLDDQAAVAEDGHCGMGWRKDAMGIVWDMDFSDEVG
jgi:hypothetical protein